MITGIVGAAGHRGADRATRPGERSSAAHDAMVREQLPGSAAGRSKRRSAAFGKLRWSRAARFAAPSRLSKPHRVSALPTCGTCTQASAKSRRMGSSAASRCNSPRGYFIERNQARSWCLEHGQGSRGRIGNRVRGKRSPRLLTGPEFRIATARRRLRLPPGAERGWTRPQQTSNCSTALECSVLESARSSTPGRARTLAIRQTS